MLMKMSNAFIETFPSISESILRPTPTTSSSDDTSKTDGLTYTSFMAALPTNKRTRAAAVDSDEHISDSDLSDWDEDMEKQRLKGIGANSFSIYTRKGTKWTKSALEIPVTKGMRITKITTSEVDANAELQVIQTIQVPSTFIYNTVALPIEKLKADMKKIQNDPKAESKLTKKSGDFAVQKNSAKRSKN